MPPPYIFLSHSGHDTAAAKLIKARLLASPEAEAAGLKIWLDVDDLIEGQPWQAQIEAAMSGATGFALVVGSRGIINWVRAETDIAMSQAVKNPAFRFTPILMGGAGSGKLTPFVGRFHAVRDPLNDTDAMQRLLRAALGREDAGLPRLTDQPFPGLRSMTEDWADRFFGRDTETNEVIALLRHQPVVSIIADSGAGKSSLAMAGVGQAWRGGALRDTRPGATDPEAWHVVTMRPGDHPMEQFRTAIETAATALSRPKADIATYRKNAATDPLFALRSGLDARTTRTLLIVDQAEELVNMAAPTERHAFGKLLAGMSQQAGGDLRILLTIRADHANLLTNVEGLGDLIRPDAGRYRLKQLADIAPMVSGPLRMAGHTDTAEQEKLIARLKSDLSERPGDLALAQMALHLAWRDRAQHGGLLAAYAANGGALGALGQEADRVSREVLKTPAERALLMPVFIRLIRLSDVDKDTAATRRIAQLSEFSDAQRKLIDRLAGDEGGRLLQTAETTVEIAHEALITQWPELHGQVNDNARDVRRLGELMKDAERWAASRKRGMLAKRVDLTEFAGLQKARPDWLSGTERSFIQRSTNAQILNNVIMVGAALVVFAAMIAAVVFFLRAAETQVNADAALADSVLARSDADVAKTAARDFRNAAIEARIDAAAQRVAAESGRQRAEGLNRAAQMSERTAIALLAQTRAQSDPVGAIKLILSSWPEAEAEILSNPNIVFHALSTAFAQPRLQTIFAGHEGRVLSAAFSPDGTRVVTASDDFTALVWDAATGQEILRLAGHEGGVDSVAFSPDGTRIVTASNDGTVRVWLAATGAEVFGLEVFVKSAAFSPDGSRIVTASDYGPAQVWEAATGQETFWLEGQLGWVNSASNSRDGTPVITALNEIPASAVGTVEVWDRATGEDILRLEGHNDGVFSLSFSPDGTRIVTGSADRTARIWDAATGEEVLRLLGHANAVTSAAFSPDGTRIVTASEDSTARVWDAATGAEILRLANHENVVTSAAFSPDGTRIVTASFDGTARVWDAALAGEIMRLEGEFELVNSAAFSPDGRRIVTTSDDGTTWVWHATTSEEIHRLVGHEDWVLSAAFSPDGTRIVNASKDGIARIWDTATGVQILQLEGHTGSVISAAFSPDGTRIVTASEDGTARVWNAATGVQIQLEYELGEVNTAVFSPDGTRIVTTSAFATSAQVWDAVTGAEILRLEGNGETSNSATFSHDGNRIVTASDDGTAQVWDAATGEQILRLEGHEGWVWSAAFSPDGTRVVTASDDGTARVWNVDLPPGNIFQIACQWLPFVNGSRDYAVEGLAADIGIPTLRPIEPCETYDPPLPRPAGGP